MIMDPAPSHPPQSCALVSDKQLGDITLLEPLTRLLSSRTGTPCSLYVKEAFRPLVELMPSAVWGPDQKTTHAYSWTTHWNSRASLMTRRVRARRKHLLVNQERHRHWWHRLFFHETHVVSAESQYWAFYFWRALGGDTSAFTSPRLTLPPEEWRHPDLPHGDYLLVNPTAAWPTKFWEPGLWAQVMKQISAEKGMSVVMTGGGTPEEKEHCARVVQSAPSSLVNLAGRTSLKQYLHAVSRARLVLCVDGSASHLAQAFDVPVVTLFGPVYPVRWHWPTPRHVAVSAFDFSSEIPPPCSAVPAAAVLEAFEKVLSQGGGSR
ncbi:hypothetical protein BGE01nite_17840 [Brevifollis gellanilyticus]|uniref:Uncharacterized protein n=2 Tax=Brevifollis gellanilyticus TaxID=748831 RepID=A0A512M6Z6_9BACT|nr:hypothetical protein BGE01nite_17840 [Brevifollis gellanilyticus]